MNGFDPKIVGKVNSIQVSDKHIYFGGEFGSDFNQPRSFLASFNRLKGTLTNWTPSISGSSMLTKVTSISLSDSILYVGGYFTKADTLSRNFLAAFDTS